ncbi:MAG: class I SAM-dependent methyltransferase [Deltaproteobacteria bacterium]|nr:class I SAM-dependent methyltransferase [Deltaproteobacteria bacterium]
MSGEPKETNWALEHIESRKSLIRASYDSIAEVREKWIIKNRYFYKKLGSFLKFIIEPDKKVLLFRSELGQLLPNFSPKEALGVDICQKMVSFARKKYPQYSFECADPEEVELKEKFDYIVFFTLGDIVDIEKAFLNASSAAGDSTRIIVINSTTYGGRLSS